MQLVVAQAGCGAWLEVLRLVVPELDLAVVLDVARGVGELLLPSLAGPLFENGRAIYFLVELSRYLLAGSLSEGLLNELARVLARCSSKPLGLDRGFPVWSDKDFDDFQEAPPIFTVNLIAPFSSVCSVTRCPLRFASILAFSTAYAWRNSLSRLWEPQLPW